MIAGEGLIKVLLNTGIVSLVAIVLITIAWIISGLWIWTGKKDVPPTNSREQSRFLGMTFLFIVLFFGTIPTVIDTVGNTYPISGATLVYLMALIPVSIILMIATAYNSHKAAFVVTLGIMVMAITILVVAMFFMAIAASAYS